MQEDFVPIIFGNLITENKIRINDSLNMSNYKMTIVALQGK